jgi:hypothetical protein
MQELFLCKAAAHWLAYKKAAGFEYALSEALLIVPIAECLAANGYTLETEIDTTKYDVGTPGLFNYDVVAERGGEIVFLETKYLKIKPSVNRCLTDLMKLALPPTNNCQRLLLVAGKAKAVELLELKPQYRMDDLEGVAESDKEFGRFLNKFKIEKSSPKLVFVQASDPIEADGEVVKAFTVSRE